MKSTRGGSPRTGLTYAFQAAGYLLAGSVLASGLLVGCGADTKSRLPTVPPTSPTSQTPTSPSPSAEPVTEPSTVPPTRMAERRVCGGYERPDLSAAECGLVSGGNLGLVAIETCVTYPPSGASIAAVECKGDGKALLPEGKEPAVYIFGFAALEELQQSFTSYAADLDIAEGDVLQPPAVNYWALAEDPPEVNRGQLMSRVDDGEAIFVWTDWDELTWISAESFEVGVEALHDWWSSGQR